MCKEMMKQRVTIKEELNNELEKCLERILKTGEYAMPFVRVDLETLFIANKEYFESQGFFFEPSTMIENKRVRYYAKMKLGGEGKFGNECWKKMREARNTFMIAQRKEIDKRLKETQGVNITINMEALLFENKLFFEGRGFIFETHIRSEDGRIIHYALMKKSHHH